MYLIVVDDSSRRLKHMLYEWAFPEKSKGRRLGEGQVVDRVGPRALLLREGPDILNVIAYHKIRNPEEFRVYRVEELTGRRMLGEEYARQLVLGEEEDKLYHKTNLENTKL